MILAALRTNDRPAPGLDNRFRLDYGLSLTPENEAIPVPVDCSLPRPNDARKIDVWGYSAGLNASFGEVLGVDICRAEIDRVEDLPSFQEAFQAPGRVLTTKGKVSTWLPYGLAFLGAMGPNRPDADEPRLSLGGMLTQLDQERERRRTGSLRRKGAGPEGFKPQEAGLAIFDGATFEDLEGVREQLIDLGFARLDPDSTPGDSEFWAAGSWTQQMQTGRSTQRIVAIAGAGKDFEAFAQDAILSTAVLLHHSSLIQIVEGKTAQLQDRVSELRPGKGATLGDVREARRERIRAEAILYAEVTPYWNLDALQATTLASSLLSSTEASRLHQRWDRSLGQLDRLTSTLRELEAQESSIEPGDIRPDPLSGTDLDVEFSIREQLRIWFRTRRSDSPDSKQRSRLIRLQPFANRSHFVPELLSSLSLNAFLTASCAIFLTQLLNQAVSAGEDATSASGEALSVAILMLFVAFFGFLFGALLYTSALSRLARRGTFDYYRRIASAKRLTEYLGVFPLVLGIPLGVENLIGTGLEGGLLIEIPVLLLTLSYFLIYTNARGISLISNEFSDTAIGSTRFRRTVVLPLMASLIILTFILQLLSISFWLAMLPGLVYVMSCIALFLLSSILPEAPETLKYEVDEWDTLSDVPGDEASRPLWPDQPGS